MQRVALAILGVLVVAVGGIGWLALSYRTMPVSNLGVAYVMGARVALTADHVHAIAKGQTPTIEFRRKAQDSRINTFGNAPRSSVPLRASTMKLTRPKAARSVTRDLVPIATVQA